MKVRQLDHVDFSINFLYDENSDMVFKWKAGGLFLSVSNVLLGGGKEAMYDIPLHSISSIEVVDGDRVMLRVRMDDIEVYISSKNVHHLMAIRHFLLPFIGNGDT